MTLRTWYHQSISSFSSLKANSAHTALCIIPHTVLWFKHTNPGLCTHHPETNKIPHTRGLSHLNHLLVFYWAAQHTLCKKRGLNPVEAVKMSPWLPQNRFCRALQSHQGRAERQGVHPQQGSERAMCHAQHHSHRLHRYGWKPGRAVTSKGTAALPAGSPSLARRSLRLPEGSCAKHRPARALPGRESRQEDPSLPQAPGQAAARVPQPGVQRDRHRAQQQLSIVLDTS